MTIVRVRAKLKDSNEFIEHQLNLDDKILKVDNDSIFEFLYDFLKERNGDIFT